MRTAFALRAFPTLAPKLRRARADLASTYGEDHPATLKALAVLGHGLQAQGRGDEAIAAMRSAFELQRARFGSDTLDSQFLQNEYGFMLVALGHLKDAVPVLQDLVERRAALHGDGSIGVVAPLSNLAHAQLRLGDLDAALATFDRAIQVLDGLPDAAPAMPAIVWRGRADVLREMVRFDDAQAALEVGEAKASSLPEADLRRLALSAGHARLQYARGDQMQGRAALDAVIAAMCAQITDSNPTLKPLIDARLAMNGPDDARAAAGN